MNAGEFRVDESTNPWDRWSVVVRIRESKDICPPLWKEYPNGTMAGCSRDADYRLATKQEIAKWYREHYRHEFKMYMKQLKRTENAASDVEKALQDWKNATEEAKRQ